LPGTNEVVNRILLTAGLVFLGWVVYRGIIAQILKRVQGKLPILAGFTPARIKIVYFTTPDCAPCKTVQKPALNRIKIEFGNQIEIDEINAYEKPEIARLWGVLSVPATFLLDDRGIPRHANFGITSYEKLISQIRSVTK
jgi:thiol-disulfide isomerase/thioredoxin